MATWVLVHGAWHGGWCWDAVAAGLRAAGHDVRTPTLTGLAERRPELEPSIGLDTHVRDVLAAVDREPGEVVLVGHSYAGMAVTAAAAARPDRVGRLVVVDGFLPERGETAIALLPEHAAAHYRDSAVEVGEGWWIPPRPMANLGVVDQRVIERVTPLLTPHPLRTYTDPSRYGASELDRPGRYLLCTGWATPFRRFAERAGDLGWAVTELPADHEVLITAPDLLTDALLAVPIPR